MTSAAAAAAAAAAVWRRGCCDVHHTAPVAHTHVLSRARSAASAARSDVLCCASSGPAGASGIHACFQVRHFRGVRGAQRCVVLRQQQCAGGASGTNARDEVRQCSGVCGAQRRVVLCQQRWACGTSGTHARVQVRQRRPRRAATGRAAPAAVGRRSQRRPRTCPAVPDQRRPRRTATCSAVPTAVGLRRKRHTRRCPVAPDQRRAATCCDVPAAVGRLSQRHTPSCMRGCATSPACGVRRPARVSVRGCARRA